MKNEWQEENNGSNLRKGKNSFGILIQIKLSRCKLN